MRVLSRDTLNRCIVTRLPENCEIKMITDRGNAHLSESWVYGRESTTTDSISGRIQKFGDFDSSCLTHDGMGTGREG